MELNTIASSFGCLSNQISEMHNFFASNQKDRKSSVSNELPPNTPMNHIAASMVAACKEYNMQKNAENTVILFVIQVLILCFIHVNICYL